MGGGAFCPPGPECPGTEEVRQPLRGGRQCGASAGRAVSAVPESGSVNPLGKGSLAGRAGMPMGGGVCEVGFKLEALMRVKAESPHERRWWLWGRREADTLESLDVSEPGLGHGLDVARRG